MASTFEEDEEDILRPGQPAGEFSDSDEERKVDAPEMKISAGLKAAIKRLRENTGHRSNIRLARALAISGAPPQVIYAAKTHKCSVCAEKKPILEHVIQRHFLHQKMLETKQTLTSLKSSMRLATSS